MTTLTGMVEKIVEARIATIEASNKKVTKDLEKRIANLEVFLAKSTGKQLIFTLDTAPSVVKAIVKKGTSGRVSNIKKVGIWIMAFRALVNRPQHAFAAEINSSMTNDELIESNLLEVTQSNISRWERGLCETPLPCLKKIVAMHSALTAGEENVTPCPDSRLDDYVAPITSSKSAKKSVKGGKRKCAKTADTAVAKLIVRCRNKYNLTMAQLADITGIAKSQLYQFHKGGVKEPYGKSMDILNKLHDEGEKDVFVYLNKTRPSGSRGRSLAKV